MSASTITTISSHLHGTEGLGVAIFPNTEVETQVILHPLTYLFYLNECVQEGISIIHPLNMRNIDCWSNGTLVHQVLVNYFTIGLEITNKGMEIHVHREVSFRRIDRNNKLILKSHEDEKEIGVVADLHQFSYIPFPPLSPTSYLADYGVLFKKFVKQSQRIYLQSKCVAAVFPDQEEGSVASSISFEGIQEGRFEDANGTIFEGMLDREGRSLIKGRVIRPDGDSFEGEWQGIHFFGKGKLTMPSGETLEGNFVKGKFVNGVKHRINGDVLSGQFKKLLFSGEGRMTWTLGHIQEGTFVNDQLIQGRKEWPSGDWLEGTFTREGFSGTGKYTGRSGIIQEGIFENWKLIKGRRYRAGQLPQDNISPPPPDLSSDFPPPTIRIVNFPRRQKRSICLIG